LIKKIRILYYLKIKLAQIYAEESKRIGDNRTSQIINEFSRSEYNQAMELLDILEEKRIKLYLIFRLLVELNSAWIGVFISFFGQRFMMKYNLHLEKKCSKIFKQLTDLPVNVRNLVEIMIEEDEKHKRFFQNGLY
jgi:hypothetical protein